MSAPRRVLLLTTELHPAGAEQVVFELATRLSRERWSVTVAALRSPGGADGAVAEALSAAGVDVRPLRLRGKLDLRGALRLARLLRALRPALVHAHLFHGNLAARLLAPSAGARVISTIHVVERRRLPARPWLERLLAGRDDATVCVSEAVRRHAQTALGARSDRLRVIENGIDLARFAPPPEPDRARREARAALGLPADAPIVGAVGRLDRQKGLDVLLEAFARLAPLHPSAVLALAGGGPEEEALRGLARARRLEARVRFLGHRRDVPAVLAALDVFCMPSRWEGFGLALAEALACGKPVVASAVDSLPEVLGEAGLLVPPERPLALADALGALLGDPPRRASLARAARVRAERFSVERMIAAYDALYAEVLGPP